MRESWVERASHGRLAIDRGCLVNSRITDKPTNSGAGRRRRNGHCVHFQLRAHVLVVVIIIVMVVAVVAAGAATARASEVAGRTRRRQRLRPNEG
jgi:hypothetical protein